MRHVDTTKRLLAELVDRVSGDAVCLEASEARLCRFDEAHGVALVAEVND